MRRPLVAQNRPAGAGRAGDTAAGADVAGCHAAGGAGARFAAGDRCPAHPRAARGGNFRALPAPRPLVGSTRARCPPRARCRWTA